MSKVKTWWDYYRSFPYHHESGWLKDVPRCPCGASVEDCGGDCYEWSLTQLEEPQ